MATGQTSVSASHFTDSSGIAVPVGSTVFFQPCDPTTLQPREYRAAGTNSGLRSIRPVPVAITSAGMLSVTLDDTTLTNPENIGYLVTAQDYAGRQLLGTGIVIQPSTANWSFDTDWNPEADPLALVYTGPVGPRGPAGISGSWTDWSVTADGSTTSWTLPQAPTKAWVYDSGTRQYPGTGNDYTISGTTITFNYVPSNGAKLYADILY